MPKPIVRDVLETCLYVDDLEAAERFYTDIVGLTFVAREKGRHLFFRCGDRMLLLFNPEATNEESADDAIPRHGAHGSGHVAFSIRSDELQTWRDHLKTHGVEVETEVQWGDRGRSLYFRDPSGNSLEIAPPVIWGIE
jgi:catechol 2,3-dioxygenase-like lactoylglutathione lyase family enzyme